MYKRVLITLAVASLLMLPTAANAVLIWDTFSGDGDIISDGDGTWDSYSTNWNDGIGNTTWNPAEVTQFGTTVSTQGGIVTLDEDVTATGLVFYKGYTLDSVISSLTLSGSSPEVVFPTGTPSGTNSQINVSFTVTDGNAGTADNLVVRGPYATPSTSYVKFDFGLDKTNGYSGSASYSGNLEISDGALVTIFGTSGLSSTGTGVIIGPGSSLRLWADGDYGAGQTLHLSGYGFGTGNTIHSSRAALMPVDEDGPANWVGNIVLDADSSIGPAVHDITVNGVISGPGKLVKTSTMALILTNQNTYTGGTQLYRGSVVLNCETGYAVLGNIGTLGTTSSDYPRLIFKHGDDDAMPQVEPTAVLDFEPTAGRMYVNLEGHTVTLGGISCPSVDSDTRAVIQNEMDETNGILIVDNDTEYTYRGIIRDKEVATTGTLAVVKRGSGLLTLDGRGHEFTGGLTVEEGTLAFGAATATTSLGSATVVVKTGANLNVSAVAGFTLADGQTLSGGGAVVGSVATAAGSSIEPGESAGMLIFADGTLDMSAGGNMIWQLDALVGGAGTPGDDFDFTVVMDDLVLGGASQLTLDFSAVGDPNESVAFWNSNHSWEIISVGGITTDNFATLVNWDFDAGDFSTSVNVDGDVILTYLSAANPTRIPGDANESGTVDEDDALLLSQNWGASGMEIGWGQGDFNDDHAVNAADAAILAANWGATIGGGESATVPEPGVLTLLLAGVLAAFATRRR